MDRMLAILKRIQPDGFVAGSVNSQVCIPPKHTLQFYSVSSLFQIATLASMNLLSFVAGSGIRDVLQMGQLKCCLDYNSAEKIASSIGIHLNDYLHST
jgi:hypothetical protein